jgi:acetyltransferase-like isoleucine patch superfamily enzyme
MERVSRLSNSPSHIISLACVRATVLKLQHSILGDTNPLPPRKENSTEDQDEELLASEAWVEAPFHADYGTNVRLGEGVFINFNCTIIDTCLVSIGSRTLLAPNVSLYSGTHPLDPDLRNGTNGPESGKPITIEEDVWIGGNVTVCPGVTIGRGSTVGAGSVVTKVSWSHLCSFPVLAECAHIQTRMLHLTRLWQATRQRSSSRRRETPPLPKKEQRSGRLQTLLEFLLYCIRIFLRLGCGN